MILDLQYWKGYGFGKYKAREDIPSISIVGALEQYLQGKTVNVHYY
jgi:hypothetical protein